MKKQVYTSLGLILVFALILSGCSGSGSSGFLGIGGGGSGSGSGAKGATVVSGVVTLSNTIGTVNASSKPMLAPIGKPGSKSYRRTSRMMAQPGLHAALGLNDPPRYLSNGTVDLYDADHPEWLYPVATGTTDSAGGYSLSSMTNASRNEGATYKDGDPIPAGNYTIVASSDSDYTSGNKPYVAIQTIVNQFEGAIPNVNFEAIDSSVAPRVVSILGLPKNNDGSNTWGLVTSTTNSAGVTTTTYKTLHPANAAIQVAFSMPMARRSLNAIKIQSLDGGTEPSGNWTLSADWLTATYYFKNGETMTPGKIYTVTIFGEDDDGTVRNVYGNVVETTAKARFKADAADQLSPTVQWNSPTVIEMGNRVDVAQSFRIEANEALDVNGITLKGLGNKLGPDGNPVTIGAKPGVVFLGKNERNLYVYEFVLGRPLKLDTTYSLTVSGGRDLSGHTMNTLTGTIMTWDAANTPGVNPAATEETQDMQAQAKSLFGKWWRALNDRNLAQFQGLMSPEFYMEYDASTHIDEESDLNRDGRYNFAEFSRMIGQSAFKQWEYCGTTITGQITPVPDTYIRVYPIDNSADFDFKLNGVSVINNQQCSDTAPRETLYATIQFKNGNWKIVRASSGIDTRDKPVSSLEVIPTLLQQKQQPLFPVSYVNVADGGKLVTVPDTVTVTTAAHTIAKFQWTPVPNVQTYILVITDTRNIGVGMAYAFPSATTSVETNNDWGDITIGGVDIHEKMGFMGNPQMEVPPDLQYVVGGRYIWNVIGLSTIKATDFSGATPPSLAVLLKDISSASTLKMFGVDGAFKELTIGVKPGTNPNASYVAFSDALRGYDVGNAYQATITVYSPNMPDDGWLNIWGAENISQNLWFDHDPNTGLSTGSVTYVATLNRGWNTVWFCDSGNWTVNPPQPQLCKQFTIYTKGGKAPVIGVWEMIDDIGNTIAGDASDYYVTTTGTKKVTISGGLSDGSIGWMQIEVQNKELGASSTTDVTPAWNGPDLQYSATVDIYKGINWVTLRTDNGMGNNYQRTIGVNTDTGSKWLRQSALPVSAAEPQHSRQNIRTARTGKLIRAATIMFHSTAYSIL